MLSTLLQESVDNLEEEFYNKPFKFSYSSLCKLLYSPAVFYQMYVLGHKEEKTDKHLIEGKLIHYLLLENHDFNDKYIVSPDKIPTGQSKLLVDTVFNKNKYLIENDPDLKFDDFEQGILDTLVSINYYQTIKTDADRLKKVVTTETANYWEFLKKKGSKDLIDADTLKYCQDAVDIIKLNPKVMNLLGQDATPSDNVEVLNEEYMEAKISSKSFGLKGFIDNLKIDHDRKIIYINDFKTSGKGLAEFKDSVEYFSYWMQAVVYMIMVSQKYYHLLEQDYELKFHFIVIDRYFNVYPFPVSDKSRNEWLNKFNLTLDIAQYHYTNRRYELPYEFDTESVIL